MGGALGSIGKALGGVIKTVAPAILKAVAPAASGLLKKITGDLFSKGAGFLKNALSALPLPGPLKALGEKLLGKGLEKLTQFAEGGIDKLIAKLGDMVMKRVAPGVPGEVALPGMNTAERQAGIANNSPTTGSSTGAASGTGGTSGTSGVNNPSGPAGAGGAPDTMPEFSGDPSSIKDQAAHQKKMFAYQQAMSTMQQFWTQLSNIQKGNDDVKKGIAQNYR